MPVSEAQKKSRDKWDAANMTHLACKLRRNYAEAFKAKCRERGTSPNAVFKEAVERFMNDEM